MKTTEWQSTFGLDEPGYSSRLFLSAKEAYAAPYGSAMAQGFSEDVSGYLTYQGKPIAVFMDESDPESGLTKELWDRLWNQGLASVLIFHRPNKVEVYSLFGLVDDEEQYDLKPLQVINQIELGVEAYKAKCADLIRSLEDGSYYSEYSDSFQPEKRVDKHLLSNLVSTCDRLIDQGLQQTEAQALLLQIIFIAYLEDRRIIKRSDFVKATGKRYESLVEVLQARDLTALVAIFKDLSQKFNSDVFSTPCIFGDLPKSPLAAHHLAALWEFRSGEIDCSTRQCALWPLYDFKFIPVELLSAIYDHFQGPEAGSSNRRDTGSYFTPAFVAQTCLDLSWKHIPSESLVSSSFKVLDPSCGSAVFLVCVFQRLVGLARAGGQNVTWDFLCGILKRMNGIDISEDALRVGIVSLYIALLEHMDPPALTPLFKQGKILPPLLGKSMRESDFFADSISTKDESYDLIIGNPPWVSRKRAIAGSMLTWCGDNGYENDVPGLGLIWGFIWKSALMLKPGGAVALLVEAKQLLFNMQAEKSRQRLFSEYKIPLLVNFADARHQWFDGADAPGALCVIQKIDTKDLASWKTDYWSIKANPEYSVGQRVVLTPDDRVEVQQWRLTRSSSVLSQRQWGRSRDLALLQSLKRFTPLGERLFSFTDMENAKSAGAWCIGQGLTPSTSERTPVTATIAGLAGATFVNANIKDFRWRLPHDLDQWEGEEGVHRARIIEPLFDSQNFHPPIILIKQGVPKLTGLMKATYTDRRVAFQHSLQAVVSTQGAEDAGVFKVLTAVLNSRLAAWFFLHASAARGVERDKVHQGEIPLLPFPLPDESDDPEAADEIIRLMDWYSTVRQADDRRKKELLRREIGEPEGLEGRFDELVYRYYGINSHERCIIDDTAQYVIPSMQPGKTTSPILWGQPHPSMLRQYAKYLQEGLTANYHSKVNVQVTVYSGYQSLLLTEIVRNEGVGSFVEQSEADLSKALEMLFKKWPSEFAMGVHHLVDMAFAVKNKIYLIKPNRVRHWMPSSALCDVDRIIRDLRALQAGSKS
jgi:hypothetical protein